MTQGVQSTDAHGGVGEEGIDHGDALQDGTQTLQTKIDPEERGKRIDETSAVGESSWTGD